MTDTTSDPPLDTPTIKAKLEELRSEHRDLDEVIDRLVEKPPFDQLQLQRLKKRKLGLKDQIIRLESQLIPDIIA
ncbi:YdcH family protein [Reyranella massiliensis]|uniref:YdcH family protein n=1 Tax=Reyranella massiliensis TaxID=445220 RepID=UPI0002EB728A|nr:YdcH family protein [Reyranella massiliensis]